MWKRPIGLRRALKTSLLIGLSLLTGCNAGTGNSGSCDLLTLRTYSPAFNARLADELRAAHPMAVWPEAFEDYRALRAAIRACKNAV